MTHYKLGILLLLFFIFSCIPLNNHYVQKSSTYNLPKPQAKVSIDLFAMSQCPYSIEAEKVIVPVIKRFRDYIDFNIYFIAEENDKESVEEALAPIFDTLEDTDPKNINRCQGQAVSYGGKFKSLHGKSEIEENIRQVVMAKYFPEKYLDYLVIRSEAYTTDDWEECAVKAWIDCEIISEISQSDKGKALFRQNIKKSNELNIKASPTLLINGRRYKGPITGNALSRTICRELPSNESCKFIPVCGIDSDCRAWGKVGTCINPETIQASCKFTEPVNFKLTLITPKDCKIYRPDSLIHMLKELFTGMEIRELDHDTPDTKALMDDLDIKILPVLYFDKEITQSGRYPKIKEKLIKTKDGFLLDSKHLFITYIKEREEKKGEVKLFVESLSPYAMATEEFLIMKGFAEKTDLDIHYIAGTVSQKDKNEVEVLTLKRDPENPGLLRLAPQKEKVIFTSTKGLKEIQEDIRQLCINKYYPSHYYDYLVCMKEGLLNSSDSINWQHCLMEDVDYQKIESCTNSQDGMRMLLGDIDMIEDLGISITPSYLVNNRILIQGIDPIGFTEIYKTLTQESQ